MKLNIQLFAEGEIVIETRIETARAERDAERLQKSLESQFKEEHLFDDFNKGLEETDKTTEEIVKNVEEINKVQKEISKQVKTNNTSLSGITQKITKWGLAVFGIRSAYMLIRQSANQLAQTNEMVASKLEVIKGSLANAISPVAETLVNLVYRLLGYLNVITKTFFKVDLFKKTAKSGKSAVGSAQKLKKTLAGFDEMNILNDASSSGGGGGGGTGAIEPEIPDTGGFQAWIDKTREQWAELLDINRVEMAKMLLEQDTTWGLMKLGWFDTIQGMARIVTGFLDVVEGVWGIIVGIANGDNEKIKQSVVKLFEGIGQILMGLLQTVLGIGEMIVGTVWGFIKSIIDFIYNKLIKPVGEWFKKLGLSIIENIVNAVNKVKSAFNSVVTFFKNIINTIVGTFKTIGTKVGDAVGGAFKTVINGVLKAIESILNSPIKAINKLLDVINKVPGINLGKLNTFNLPRLAKGGVVNMPGRGVPIGNAVAGERGQEGVIPLTDSQQMALLGEAIGRYITINANITNTMNGRVISRELQKINNESNFASNR